MAQRNEQPGRLPEKYYQRRRAAAAGVLIVVVILLIWALTAWAGSRNQDGDAQAASTEETTTVETSTTEVTTTEEMTPEQTAPSETEEPDPESPYPAEEEGNEVPIDPARTTCELSDLMITASSDQANYAPDAEPTFYMTVANPTAADCEINLDEEPLRFEVYDLATNARMWSDTDCAEPAETGLQTFEAGSERYFEVVWSKTASAPEQCQQRPSVPPASYFLHAVVGSNPSPAHTFNLG